MELLIYNLSHSDLILGFKPNTDDQFLLTRPRFSKFNQIASELLSCINEENVELFSFPLHHRNENRVLSSEFYLGLQLTKGFPSFPYDFFRFKDSDEEKVKHYKGKLFSLLNEIMNQELKRSDLFFLSFQNFD